MKNFWPVLTLLGTLLVTGAHAQTPPLVPLHGSLAGADGKPIKGQVQVVFALYAAAQGGKALYTETHTLDITNGAFNVLLGDHLPLDPALFATHTDLFLGTKIEDDAEAKPRMRLGSVPFAAAADFAHDAAALEGMGVDELQRRVVGTCEDGEAMVAIDADGAIRCASFDKAGGRGPAGPTGPEGQTGPKGDRGERGPVASFDCEGDAVSSVDSRGRVTCVPLAKASVSAGDGLDVACQGDDCKVSVAANSVGMEQVDLPINTDKTQFTELLNGEFFYPVGSDFVPKSDGQCLIIASVEVGDPVAADGRTLGMSQLELRVGYEEDGVYDGVAGWSIVGFGSARPDGTATGGAIQHLALKVTAGKTYKFGCLLGANGAWVGKAFWCQATRLCL